MFGDKGTVDRYSIFEVMECMSYQRDRDRRIGWMHRFISKRMEQEAKAKAGK